MIYNTLNQMKAKSLDSGKYADGQGLWLIKRSKIAGKWVLRLPVRGKRREMGLGPWPDVSIAEARELATKARKQLREGTDPIDARLKEKYKPNRLTIKEAVESCFEARKAELKHDGQAGRWLSPLSIHVLPKIGNQAIEDLDQHMLKSILQPIWHTKSDVARKAVNRINLTLKHAAALGLEVDLQATMKARALLGKQRHQVKHIPSLPYQEAPAFYQMLCTRNYMACLALRFLILTVARSSEVRLARYDEIHDDIWILPSERTKTGREHRVPIIPEMKRVIESAQWNVDQEHLFCSTTGKPLSNVTMSSFMKREGYEARPHGFRATFRTWVEEQTDTEYETKEAALGHVVDNETVRAYQRSDRLEKRRKLLKQWGKYLRKS